MTIHSTTRRGKFDAIDLRKTVRDFLFVFFPALVTYLTTDVMPRLEESEIPWIVVVGVPLMGAVVAGINRWLRDNQPNST